MLQLDALSCGYGDMCAVSGLTLDIAKGEVTALLGANGAGKTSVIMCIAGHVVVQQGRILLGQDDITFLPAMRRIVKGIAVVPEGRRLFASLTVRENLIVGGYTLAKDKTSPNIDRVISVFPRLGERLPQLAGSLSGGEQQMLAIGRALMAEPDLILIDELSLGLMPKAIDLCCRAIETLKQNGITIVLVEQNTERALEMADQVCVLESGRTVFKDTAEAARHAPSMIDALLGIQKKEPRSF